MSSSRGRSVKRGVRQRFSTYKVRKWGPTSTVKNIDYKAAIVVIGKGVQGEVQVPAPSLTLANTDHEELVMAK